MKTLYHYCPVSSFASIISSKSIWLSSLSLSNDSMEGRLVTKTFEKLLLESNVGDEEAQEIRKALLFIEDLYDGLGFCLSEKPDILSQWRGYADDGQGFSIGFGMKYLDELSKLVSEYKDFFYIGKIEYSPEKHKTLLKPAFMEIMSLVESGKLRKPIGNALSIPRESLIEYKEAIDSLHTTLFLKIFFKIFMLKTKAFKEEAEWRLVSFLQKNKRDAGINEFRPAGNKLIPYKAFDLLATNNINAISTVYIGPKNITPDYVVKNFLEKNGFKNVTVKRSAASYR